MAEAPAVSPDPESDPPSNGAFRGCPVVAVCGYSGAGKTTLLESVLPDLVARGLSVLVVKQDAHRLELDREGKDTDRLFRAGADALIRDARQAFLRLHDPDAAALERVAARHGADYDLILVEGHKSTSLPWKVWLTRDDNETPPPEAVGIRRVVGRGEDRKAVLLAMLEERMAEVAGAVPVYGGILIGGASRRMGRPKHLIADGGRTWLERAADVVRPFVQRVAILGAGEIPAALRDGVALPDAEDAAGPMRGLRAALRWAPRASWLFVACDLPRLRPEAIAWVLSHRRPGARAVIPRQPDTGWAEPLLAWYDFRMAGAIERASRPMELARCAGVLCPDIPSSLADAWHNANTPESARR